MADMARAGGIDVLTGDYLAEVTMLILGKARQGQHQGLCGHLPHLDAALEHLSAKNPARRQRRRAQPRRAGRRDPRTDRARGYDLRVSHIDGDDVFGRLDALQQAGHSMPHLERRTAVVLAAPALTANAYLGGFGIARALANGADIVITGRVADAVVVGPAAWWWSWTPDDYDALAGAVAAGHVIECGPQATGGNFSGFPYHCRPRAAGVPDRRNRRRRFLGDHQEPGHRRRRHPDTVTAQLLYEIGEPAYLNPDVTTHLDTAALDRPRRRPRRDPRCSRVGATGDDQGRDHRGRRLGTA